MKIIIKPFSEIMIKSKPVRKRYMQTLQQNLYLALKKISNNIKVNLFWDKLEVNLINENIKEHNNIHDVLSKTPGIETFLEVENFDLGNFEYILEKTAEFYLNKIENKSFVVRVKRSGNHDFKSTDIERFLGGGLLQKLEEKGIHGKIDLHNPEVTVQIEIKDNNLFIVKNSYTGIGGYPTGTQDKVLSLISGGFDSGVSSYSMIKRGCKVDFLFFNLGGKAHELGVKQVSYFLNSEFSSGYNANIITIPFENIVKELLINIDNRYRGIILKRCMLKIADKIAKEKGYFALIKGDSLGQVSSQTLKNMHVIDKACETLVLRPLISFNKQEIIDISRKIGTYDFAINMPEYCGIISDKPATGAKLHQILNEEEKFDENILENAYLNKKIVSVNEILNEVNKIDTDINFINFPEKGDIIIDIREELLFMEKPIKITSNKIINIPFFDINFEFEKLDQNKTYLLYCDKGILSKLHALYLKEKGFNNIGVFRMIKKDKICGII